MKKLFLIMVICNSVTSFTQNKFVSILGFKKHQVDSSKVLLYINSDVNFSSSINDTRKESKAGVGKIGLNFETNNVYGDVLFTVYSKDNVLSTIDSNEIKLFGTNLLLPQNSSNDISNFSASLGIKSFYKHKKISGLEPFFSWKKFGLLAQVYMNNTIWTKNAFSLPISIITFNGLLTYKLLSLKVNESDEKISLVGFGGFSSRRLGGDFGLEENKDKRIDFLGYNNIGYNGLNYGLRLEVGSFFGQVNFYSFARTKNISGFSGNQSVVSLGLRVKLKIVASKVN